MTTSETTTYKNFISGAWTTADSGKTYPVTNPASNTTVIGQFQTSGASDALRAAEAAKSALPGWANTPAPARAAVLFKALEIMRRRFDEMARTINIDEGKHLADAQGEVKRARHSDELAAGEGRRMFGCTT